MLVVLGAFEGLLATPVFASLATPIADERLVPTRRPGPVRWWIAFVLTAAIPAVTFYPLMDAGFAFLPSRLFPEWVANQVVVWGLGSTALGLIGYLFKGADRTPLAPGGIKAVVLAAACVALGYAALAVVDAVFKVDFRFWVLGLKPLDARHAVYALAYLVPFAVIFVPMVRMLIANVFIPGRHVAVQCAAMVAAPCLGFVVLLAIQYASLRATGLLANPKEALNTIIAIQFAPILAFVGLTAAFTWRRTRTWLPGGVICALVITWYMVAGTATHWRPGWTLPHNAGLFPARPAAGASPRS